MADKENIFNISTGKTASGKTTDFMISEAVPETAVQECCDDTSRYSTPNKRQKMKIFSTESGKYKISSSSENKLVSISKRLGVFCFMHYRQRLAWHIFWNIHWRQFYWPLVTLMGWCKKTKVKLLNELETKTRPIQRISAWVFDRSLEWQFLCINFCSKEEEEWEVAESIYKTWQLGQHQRFGYHYTWVICLCFVWEE